MNRSSHSLVEVVLVLLLLVLIALSVFSATELGSRAYLALQARQDADSDLRIAVSYLNIKIRKNDNAGALSIQPDPFGGQTALLIRQEIEGSPYITWVYLYEGNLRELLVAPDSELTPEMGTVIARLDGWSLEPSARGIAVTLTRQNRGRTLSSRRDILLRSEAVTS